MPTLRFSRSAVLWTFALFGLCLAVLVLWVILQAFGSANTSWADEPAGQATVVAAAVETTTNPDGDDWPVFLGESGYGISGETGLLKKWPAGGPPLLWEKQIGTGYSAPSVLGSRVVVHHRVDDEEIVECLDAKTAETIWIHKNASNFSDPYGYNNGPRCSPLLTQTHCFTFGAEGRLLCLELETGKLVWEHTTQTEFDVPDAFFGVGATPILEDGRLFVLVGGQPNSGVVAYDAKTGRVLWQNVGKSTWNGVATGWPGPKNYEWTGTEMVVSYSSPITATIHGKRHLLCLVRQGLVSVDPATGTENFHYWFRSRDHESVNAARPVVIGDSIFLTAAYRMGAAYLKVAADGKSVTEVWRDGRALGAHWSTPIPVGNYLYGFDGRHENGATLRCIETATGQVEWQTSGWEGPTDQFRAASRSTVLNTETNLVEPWPYYGRGSAILADGNFIVLGERGTVALVPADPKQFVEISRFKPDKMEYPCWAAPVLSRGQLYLRCENWLVCYDLNAD